MRCYCNRPGWHHGCDAALRTQLAGVAVVASAAGAPCAANAASHASTSAAVAGGGTLKSHTRVTPSCTRSKGRGVA